MKKNVSREHTFLKDMQDYLFEISGQENCISNLNQFEGNIQKDHL